MINSKFDLYKSEWLELVFAKRNKEYGAYYLRHHYAENIIKAMGITFFSVTAIFFTLGILIRQKPAEAVKETVVTIQDYKQPPPVEPKKEIQKAQPAPAKAPVTTKAFVPMVVTKDPVTIEPPKSSELTGNIGQTDVSVPGKGIDIVIDEGPKTTGTGAAIDDETIHNAGESGLEVMPEPYGGAAAWAKFLQKNLRYPTQAAEQSISGKVFVSFIIEKNGHLSSLEIVRGVGYGMDDEALRVLKLAPPWKPGMQNGHPVRVKYTLPLNFILDQ